MVTATEIQNAYWVWAQELELQIAPLGQSPLGLWPRLRAASLLLGVLEVSGDLPEVDRALLEEPLRDHFVRLVSACRYVLASVVQYCEATDRSALAAALEINRQELARIAQERGKNALPFQINLSGEGKA